MSLCIRGIFSTMAATLNPHPSTILHSFPSPTALVHCASVGGRKRRPRPTHRLPFALLAFTFPYAMFRRVQLLQFLSLYLDRHSA